MKTADPYKAKSRQFHATLKRRAGREPVASLDELRKEFDFVMKKKPWCEYCRRGLTLQNVSLDHRWPVHRGGAHEMANLAFVCRTCNVAKGNRSQLEYTDILEALDLIGVRRCNPNLRDEIVGELMRVNSFLQGKNRRDRKAAGR